jgi:hypothetical protein
MANASATQQPAGQVCAPHRYLPRWLEWLPRFELEEPAAAPEAKPASVSA